jgi:hypothetical protein
VSEEIRYPSSTSITGNLPNFGLPKHYARLAVEAAFTQQDQYRDLPTREERMEWCRDAADRHRDAAADLGTEIHVAVEAHILGKPVPTWPLPIRARMTHFMQFMNDYELDPEASETKVYSRKHRYAGTLDILGRLRRIDDRMAVIDLKTGKGIYSDKFSPQVASYARADFLVADPHHPGAVQVTPDKGKRYYTWNGPAADEHPMPDVQAGYILHLRDDGYDVYEITDLDKAFDAFLALLPVDRWLNGGKNGVLRKLKKPKPVMEEAA